jgi:hypothetical protein
VFIHPHIGRELARERQRDLQARAHQERLVQEARQARQLQTAAGVAEHLPQPRQRLRRALRAAAALLRAAPEN